MTRISNVTAYAPVLDTQPVQQVRNWNPSRLDWAALNPQPLPPKEKTVSNWLTPGNSISLNPQPLPPKDVFANVKAAYADAARFHSENPEVDRGVIVIGGKSGVEYPPANRAIFVVGGRIHIR